MRKSSQLIFVVLTSVLLTPIVSFCTSIALVPASADLVRSGKAVVVAYEDEEGVRIQANSIVDGCEHWNTHIRAEYLESGLCESDGLVYVPTSDEGVFVVDAVTGSVRARLRPRNPVCERPQARGHISEHPAPITSPIVACTGNRVLVGYAGENWLVAYSTRDFHPVWKQLFRSLNIYEISADDNEFTALAEVGSGQNQWKHIKLCADNGKIVSKRSAAEPGYTVPEYLPKPIREWFFRSVGGRFTSTGRFTFEHGGGHWFIGVPADMGEIGAIYAVQNDGDVVWTKRVTGLSVVILAGNRLVAITRYDNNECDVFGKLFALDATAGRQLWTVDVKE